MLSLKQLFVLTEEDQLLEPDPETPAKFHPDGTRQDIFKEFGVPHSSGKSGPSWIREFSVDHLASFLQTHLTCSVAEVHRAYLDLYSTQIDAIDPETYRGIGFALSNHHDKPNCNFINIISAMFALCNCSSEFHEHLVGHLTMAGCDSEFLRTALEASKTGHIILATILFVLSVRNAIEFDVEYVGINGEKSVLDQYFTETHPLLDEVSEVLLSRFGEVKFELSFTALQMQRETNCRKAKRMRAQAVRSTSDCHPKPEQDSGWKSGAGQSP
jgi:hypothetical protein